MGEIIVFSDASKLPPQSSLIDSGADRIAGRTANHRIPSISSMRVSALGSAAVSKIAFLSLTSLLALS